MQTNYVSDSMAFIGDQDLDGRLPISRFFQQFDVYDLMPFSTRVVTMNWNLSLYRAFRVMGENNITNLFGWCPITKRYMCVLTSSDIMRVTLNLHRLFFDEENPNRLDPVKFLVTNDRACIVEALKNGHGPNILTLLNTISIKEWKLRPRIFDSAGYDTKICISKQFLKLTAVDDNGGINNGEIGVTNDTNAISSQNLISSPERINSNSAAFGADKKSPAMNNVKNIAMRSADINNKKKYYDSLTEEQIETSRVPRFLYGFPDTNLYTAIRFLFQNKIHRFPVIAKDGSITHSITYRSICRFLVSNFRFQASILSTPLLGAENIGDTSPITIEMDTTLCEAVTLLLKYNLSVIPVIQINPTTGKRELLDVFSKYDYISLSKMHDFDCLDRTIRDVISERPKGVEGLFTLPHDATIGRVLKEIAQNDLHRVLLVDRNDKKTLRAVVSLRHILVFLVADSTTESILTNEIEENRRKQDSRKSTDLQQNTVETTLVEENAEDIEIENENENENETDDDE